MLIVSVSSNKYFSAADNSVQLCYYHSLLGILLLYMTDRMYYKSYFVKKITSYFSI